MVATHAILALVVSILPSSSAIASQLVERAAGQGYGLITDQFGTDDGLCPANTTINCSTFGGCCPTGSFCFGGAFSAICCATDVDCTEAVKAAQVCADPSWGLFNVGGDDFDGVADGYLYCCQPGHVAFSEGECVPASLTTESLFATALDQTIVQGHATQAATTTAGSGKVTITAGGSATPTTSKPSFGIKHNGNIYLSLGTVSFVLLVGLL